MGADDKIKNVVTDVSGKVKEKIGQITDDPEMQAEGQWDQTKADLSRAKENVKDAYKD
jgi:uncharacterized protein YjbJ (UPF0337 family)